MASGSHFWVARIGNRDRVERAIDASDSVYLGSNPSLPAKKQKARLMAGLLFF